MRSIVMKIDTLKKNYLATGIALASIVVIACNGDSEPSSTDTTDSLSQPVEDNGVPLNSLERSRDTDIADQQIENNSGVPLDNLNRDRSKDTTSQPNLD
ncbi:hypothetical protein [Sphingobacterium arenae]|uniref:Uncharacterized protein n=1 Tax=Sphingobacterium arenae TaxID=1280598 RepID=A0ABR7Y5F4_9SPHI|nr:hypothetical protein [Sphingobacterium arenae]MBD1426542.1 hypothetical protein [Sphingobacterium arenae]